MTDALLATLRDDFRISPGLVVESALCGLAALLLVPVVALLLVGIFGGQS